MKCNFYLLNSLSQLHQHLRHVKYFPYLTDSLLPCLELFCIYYYYYCCYYYYYYYYTGCPRRNVKYFGRVFLELNYTDITQNTYIQS